MFKVGNLAERQGFEPWVPFGTHAFQACALDRYATSPIETSPPSECSLSNAGNNPNNKF